MALRESPIRRQPSARPPWLIPVLVAVGLLVVVALVFGVRSLLGGGSASSADASTEPTPCVTQTVTLANSLPTAGDVKVNVYNATATSGLAAKTASALEKRGFQVGHVGNDPAGKPVTGVAVIRYGPHAEMQAQLLQLYVPGAELVKVGRGGKKVDLVMGQGFTDLAQQSDVDTQLAAPSPVATGPGCPAPSAS
jgi:hypothetical protein